MGEAPHEVYTDAELKARAEPRCGNCKWWERREHKDWGYCEHKMLDPYNQDAEVFAGRHEPIATEPTFGCIHFEPKT